MLFLLLKRMPALPARTLTGVGLAYSVACAAICTLVAHLGVVGTSLRFIVVLGSLLVLSLPLDLAVMLWARRRGVPLVPRQEIRVEQQAWDRMRPLPAFLLGEVLPRGILAGLSLGQIVGGRPFWEVAGLSWPWVAAGFVLEAVSCLVRRSRAVQSGGAAVGARNMPAR